MLTPELGQQIVSLLRAGNTISVATSAVGVAERTFRDWIQRGSVETEGDYRDLKEHVDQARSEAEARNVAKVAAAAGDDWRAAAWLLERREPERWGAKAKRGEQAPSPEAQAVFMAAAETARQEAMQTLERIGEDPVLSEGAIARYSSAVGAWRMLEHEWERLGRPGMTEGGSTGSVLVPHPLVSQIAGARREAAHLGGGLGLDPRGRLLLTRRVVAGRPQGAASAPDRAQPPPVRTLRSVS